MKITRWNIATEGTTDLRDRALFSYREAVGPGTAPDVIRWRANNARRALAFLRAADRIDARLGIVSDGLHYADGQLFNVNNDRPEEM